MNVIARAVACIAVAGVAANTALSQPTTPAFDWVTVGAAGNRGATAAELPWAPEAAGLGAVDHAFNITRTEVTIEQWWPFANAYQQYVAQDDNTGWVALSGRYLDFTLGERHLIWNDQAAHFPVQTNWYMAARYTNWLHNGMRTDRAAFESGVYDTSTWTTNPDGSRNDQRERSPGAVYFLPNQDEYAKAAYYDPDRYGDGLEGYWTFPNRSQSPPTSGPPDQGGTTNAGTFWTHGNLFLNAGSYPEARSAFGLLDTSGGQSEWNETAFGTTADRAVFGSQISLSPEFIPFYDRIDLLLADWPTTASYGFRMAATIPSPGSGFAGLVLLGVFLARKGRQ